MEYNHILVRFGELTTKGKNRKAFIQKLYSNTKKALGNFKNLEYKLTYDRLYILLNGEDEKQVCDRLKQVFGIHSFSLALKVESELEAIKEAACHVLKETPGATFKIETKRNDKSFPLQSNDISRAVAGYIFHHIDREIKVDVHNPEVTVTVEIRDFGAYIHVDQINGAGGMPVGTGGKAAILISGGIDSPVAAYMLAKRGVRLTAIHFASPPYTSERAEMKVKDLLSQVAKYSGGINFCYVPFTKIQENIAKHCPEDLTTLIMRRYMMKIAERIAKAKDCDALITGESIGQVASQTMKALAVTDCAVNMPVFRPLIGMDKEEIVKISRDIGTFEISTLPYEDCCTVFTPKHPRTKPNIPAVIRAESYEGCEQEIEEAIQNATFEMIY